jgi:hypothetical protein
MKRTKFLDAVIVIVLVIFAFMGYNAYADSFQVRPVPLQNLHEPTVLPKVGAVAERFAGYYNAQNVDGICSMYDASVAPSYSKDKTAKILDASRKTTGNLRLINLKSWQNSTVKGSTYITVVYTCATDDGPAELRINYNYMKDDGHILGWLVSPLTH